MANSHSTLEHTIISCTKCPRLRNHCQEMSQIKRKAYRNEAYWGKPVIGFGRTDGELVIVGLAPAAHGANRTGRIFTGDRSGDWLFRALHKAGFANQPTSTHSQDGLILINSYITCVVKCAPPDNKPSVVEQQQCRTYLEQEISTFTHAKVWVALGQIAFHSLWKLFKVKGTHPPFKHGAQLKVNSSQWLLLSYHPSQQNTFTRRLTEPMFDSVFSCARELLSS